MSPVNDGPALTDSPAPEAPQPGEWGYDGPEAGKADLGVSPAPQRARESRRALDERVGGRWHFRPERFAGRLVCNKTSLLAGCPAIQDLAARAIVKALIGHLLGAADVEISESEARAFDGLALSDFDLI